MKHHERVKFEIEKIVDAQSKYEKLTLIATKIQQGKISFEDILNNADKLSGKGELLNSLGFAYESGNSGFEKSATKSYQLYALSADKNNTSGIRNKAICLMTGRGIEKNIDSAIMELKKIINGNGISDEFYLLGRAYRKKAYQVEKGLREPFFKNAATWLLKTPREQNDIYVQSRFFAIKCYFELGQDEEALRIFRKLSLAESAKSDYALISKSMMRALKNKIAKLFPEKLEQPEKTIIKDEIRKAKKTGAHLENNDDNNEKQLYKQLKVERKFFDPARNIKESTKKIAIKLQKNRLVKDDDAVKPIQVSDAARTWITAEKATILLAKDDSFSREDGCSWEYRRNHYWKINLSNSYSYAKYPRFYTNNEIIIRGNSEFKYHHRINSHNNHRGDFHSSELGEYASIYNVLRAIVFNQDEIETIENEKTLCEQMREAAKNGSALTLAQLQIINAEVDEELVKKVNRIIHHCFIKEPARWMLPSYEYHDLPLTSAQARAVTLIIEGHLRLKDVFMQFSDYGVFTDKEIGKNIEHLKGKIININKLYNEKHPEELVLKSAPLKKELQDFYGGVSDSEGENYSGNESDVYYEDNEEDEDLNLGIARLGI